MFIRVLANELLIAISSAHREHPPVTIDFDLLETCTRQDPGGRGVSSFKHDGQCLAAGMLQRAAHELAQHATAVAIVTGFYIAGSDPPAAETDGPPGALYLARALRAVGCDVMLISDRYAMPLLELGCRLWSLDAERFEVPLSGDGCETWIDEVWRSPIGKRLSHLIAIERVGPSHTLESLAAQLRSGAGPLERFAAEVPPDHRDACHNMRGLVIDEQTAPAHRLFEAVQRSARGIKTLAIGDGGNEIGMGTIPWEVLRAALKADVAGRIICRIATDYLIMAGVSNWGAYALACAMASLRGRGGLLAEWDSHCQRALIEALVHEGGAIDGLTGRHEPTVDGLPLDAYLGVLEQIRRACW